MEPNKDDNSSIETNKESVSYNTPIQNMVEESTKDGTVGPLIGSILIIILIIVGGIYFWSSIINTSNDSETNVSAGIDQQIVPEL